MLTNLCDAFGGKSRSPNIVPFRARYSFLLCNSNFVFKTRHFYDTENLYKKEKWQKESYKPVAIAVRLRSTPML